MEAGYREWLCFIIPSVDHSELLPARNRQTQWRHHQRHSIHLGHHLGIELPHPHLFRPHLHARRPGFLPGRTDPFLNPDRTDLLYGVIPRQEVRRSVLEQVGETREDESIGQSVRTGRSILCSVLDVLVEFLDERDRSRQWSAGRIRLDGESGEARGEMHARS